MKTYSIAVEGPGAVGASPPFTRPLSKHRFLRVWSRRNVLIGVVDVAVIMGAVLLAYVVRFNVDGIGREVPTPDVMLYVKSGALFAATWIYGLWREGAYERGLRGIASPAVRLRLLMRTGLHALAALMAIGFLYRELLLSRQVYLTSGVLAIVGLALTRALFHAIDVRLARRGLVSGQVAIIGTSRAACDFAETVERETHGTLRVCGFISAGEPSSPNVSPWPVLGDVTTIELIHRVVWFDKLVLAAPHFSAGAIEGRDATVMNLLNFCEEHDVAFYMLPGSFDVAVEPSEIASFSGMPLIRLKDASLHPFYAATKRAMDIAAATLLLLIGLPFWLVVVAAIKLTSPGPVLFSQWRAGHHGKPFRMYKFRSMTIDAEARLAELVDFDALHEPVFKIKNDPRVTPLGRWLRRTGIDEIPQLINVLKGEMSIVGPRPEEVALVGRYDHWQRRRLKAKPGITGYQQIKNRGDASLADRVKFDLIYLKHQSFTLDLYILLKTPFVILRGSGITH